MGPVIPLGRSVQNMDHQSDSGHTVRSCGGKNWLSHAGRYIECDEATNGPRTPESEAASEQVVTETRAPERRRPN